MKFPEIPLQGMPGPDRPVAAMLSLCRLLVGAARLHPRLSFGHWQGQQLRLSTHVLPDNRQEVADIRHCQVVGQLNECLLTVEGPEFKRMFAIHRSQNNSIQEAEIKEVLPIRITVGLIIREDVKIAGRDFVDHVIGLVNGEVGVDPDDQIPSLQTDIPSSHAATLMNLARGARIERAILGHRGARGWSLTADMKDFADGGECIGNRGILREEDASPWPPSP